MHWQKAVVLVLVAGMFDGFRLIAAEPTSTMESVRQRLEAGEPTRIVCFGDSITGAYYHTGGQRAWCDLVGIGLQRAFPNAHITMFNAGISGQTTVQGLARIEKDVLDKRPHLVIVMFGMNDVTRLPFQEFGSNLRVIVQKCRDAGAAVVLCTPNSVYENTARPNSKLAELSEVIRQIAKEEVLPLADCFADYCQHRAQDDDAWMLLMSDEIHPNLHGHRRLAEVVTLSISGQRVQLDNIPPLADALHHTSARLEAGEAIHLVAMQPYDQWLATALRDRFPQAAEKIRVTTWPTESGNLHEISRWGAGIRDLNPKPDLVVPAVPVTVTSANAASFIRDYEWVLNWSFPFAGRAWDVVPVVPAASAAKSSEQWRNTQMARQIVLGKDVRFLESAPDATTARNMLSAWIAEQALTRRSAWAEVPATNASVSIPAQEWTHRPGPRQVKVWVHYPQGKLEHVNSATGIMLSLHNWGGENCAGTADPQVLADKLNVVTLCVNYLQSGRKDSIDSPEPYDCGYLQALDALRALWWMKSGLQRIERPFAVGRVFATGGSGGGNVALMANKLAPRTFASIVDMCGMKKLSHDIAFNLPGGSDLNARWSRDPSSTNFLAADQQDLRFIGHPQHLALMKQLSAPCRVFIVHGVDDKTCLFEDAQELVGNMQEAKLSVEPRFITRGDLDGVVFTSSGHALGNRTEIVFKVAGELLTPAGEHSIARRGPDDFERRDELVGYQTPSGRFVISYAAGFPVGRFEPDPAPFSYSEHQHLDYYLDAGGNRHLIRNPADWQIRRQHILGHMQRVMGTLPGASFRVPLRTTVMEEVREAGFLRRRVSFQSDPFDRVTAWLLLPVAAEPKRRPAVLCLHQTIAEGKNEPVGLAGSANMHYARELVERGYVVLAPDYPSLGEHVYDFAQNPEFASGSMKAIWDNVRAVDLLTELPEVDPQRIGVIGHSLGAHNALFTSAFEARIKVVVSSCGFTSLLRDDLPSWTGPRYMPRIANVFGNDIAQMPFDFSEVVATLAPRPLLVCAATRDSDFDVQGVREVIAAAQPVYTLLGGPQHLEADYPDSPHDFPTPTRQRAYEFLDRHLHP